jgi:hypothetical protein
MNLSEIKRAISEGLRVYWQNPLYEVVLDPKTNAYYISCLATGHSIKLIQSDDLTLNGAESDFYASQD